LVSFGHQPTAIHGGHNTTRVASKRGVKCPKPPSKGTLNKLHLMAQCERILELLGPELTFLSLDKG